MDIPGIALVEAIWRRSGDPTDYAYLSTMHRPQLAERGRWDDYPFIPQEGAEFPIETQPHEHDLFFSPLRFSKARRSNDTVHRPGVLFADLDDAPVNYGKFRPTILWETSPGNRQAVWFLRDKLDLYYAWAQVNRRLTHHLKADPGGWMGSKVLRVPGSINWKRRAFGKVLWYEPNTEYPFDWMNRNLPQIPTVGATLTGDYPKLPTSKESTAIIVSRWDSLSLRGRNMLMKERVSDRSLHIVKTIHELSGGGLSPEDIFVMIWWRPWNKWRHRDNPDLLWSEIVHSAE